MFRHILVPLDGSRLAAAAIPYAVTLARAYDARISLLAVVEPLPSERSVSDETQREADDRRVNTTTAYLESIATRVRAQGPMVSTAVHHGNPAEEIIAFAEYDEVALIVMSTHGRSGLSLMRMGSVAQHVIRHAVVPTLAVRAEEERAETELPRIDRVTVTLDGSDLSEQALPVGVSIAKALGVPLTLLRIVPNLAFYATYGWEGAYLAPTEEMERDEEQGVEEYLHAVADRIGGADIDVRTAWRRSVTNRAEEPIVRYLTEVPTGIVVMASHGRGGVVRWALGSTAERILTDAPSPVLIVRPETAPQE